MNFSEVKNIVSLTVDESKKEAHRLGLGGRAIECPDCGQWYPYRIEEDWDKVYIDALNRHPYKNSSQCFNCKNSRIEIVNS